MGFTVQESALIFKSRGQDGKIHITMKTNHDEEHGQGLDLIFPDIPHSEFERQFFGFPVIKAEIEYPIPFSTSFQYGHIFGWIQLVKVKSDRPSDARRDWQMDIYPAFMKGSNSPFTYFGFKPTLFDAPAMLLKEDDERMTKLEWRAQSFLCVIEDVGMTQTVKVCPGGGFGWGFDISTKNGTAEEGASRKIDITEVAGLDLNSEWNGRAELLRKSYPEWTFSAFESK